MRLRYLCLFLIACSLLTSTAFAACPAPQYLSQYNVTHQSVQMYWSYSGSGSPTYQLQWRPAGGASWNVSPALTTSQHSLTGLTNNTTYEWRVRAVCAEGDTSAFSTSLSFRTKCDAPTYPAANDLTHQSARLSWGSTVSGATYEVRWRRAGTTDWTIIGSLTTTSLNLTGLANNTTYEWQVRTLCSSTADSDFTSIMLFQTQCAMPFNPATSRTAVDAAELTWQSSLANVRFDLQWRAAGTANWTMVTDLNARDYVLTGLINTTTYEWQVRTACSSTEKSAFTNPQTFQTGCALPYSLQISSVTHNAAQLSWFSPTNVELQWRAAGAADWTTVPDVRSPYRLTGLQNNTTYEWRVRAMCASGIVSDYTPTQSLITRCVTPTNLSGYGNSVGGLSFFWNNSVGESFEVQWRVAGTTVWSAATGITTTTYSLTGLAANVDYEWRVRQICSATETSDFALGQVVRTVCSTPFFLRTDNLTQSSARLIWDESETGARYELQWRPAGAADWTIVAGIATPGYSLTGLVSNRSYEWRLRKQCAGGATSDFTSPQTFALQCTQPTYANGYPSSPTSAYLFWSGDYAYPPYELQWRLLGATDWTTVSGLLSPGYTLTGLTTNSTYEWRVRSNCSTGEPTDFTPTQTVQTRCDQALYLAQPQNVTFDQAELSWTIGSSTTPYEMQYRDILSTDWITVPAEDIQTNAYYERRHALYRLVPGRTYAWRVRAVCGPGVYGNFTDGLQFTTACQVPQNVSGYASNSTTLTASWYSWLSATNYELQWRAVGETNWNAIDNLTVQTYRLTNLTPGISYEYRVQQACSADIRSGFSATQTTTLSCAGPPSLTLRALSATSAQLAWSAYESIPYEVQYRPVGNPDWTTVSVPAGSTNLLTIQGSTSTTYSLTGLAAGGRYESRIRAACAPGVTSNYTNTATVQLGCPAPVMPSVQVGATVARLFWNDPYGAAAYQVQWRPSGAPDWTSATVANGGQSSVTFTLPDLMPNTTYEWRVAGDCGGGDRSAYGPVQLFQTNCPAVQYVTVNGTGATQARLSWSVAGNGLFSGTYTLQYRTSGSVVWTELSGLTTNAVSLTGLQINTTYEYRVRAVCESGASTPGASTPGEPATFSSTNTFQTQCSYPSTIYVTRVDTQSATIGWTLNFGDELPVDLQWRPQNAFVWTDVPGLTGSTYSFTGLSPNTPYVVRLRTVCPVNNPSAYTPYFATFTPSAPASDLSLYVGNISAQTARLARSGAVDGQRYVFQWRIQNASIWNTTGPVTATAYLLTDLTNNTPYEARIGIVGADGAITYGPANTFRTFCVAPAYLTVANVTTASARLTWVDSQIPVVVQWRSGGASAWNTVAAVTGGSYSLTGLTNNTTYEWRLQTTCSPEVASAFVYGASFRTLCRMPDSPLTQAVTHNSAQLRWNSSGSAFTVRYRPVGASNWAVLTGLGTTNYTLMGLLNNTTYEWGVATTCGPDGNTAYTSSLLFTTQCGLPDNLQINALAPDRAELTWSGAGPTYQLDWRTLGSSVWSRVSDVTSPYTLTGLTNGGSYEWRVRSTYAVATDGPFATGYSFTTQCPFSTYNNESTTGISSGTARLNWNASRLVTYKLRWRPVGNATWTVVTTGVTAPYVLTGLTNNTTYEWQIGTDCQSNYANLQTFQTRCTAPPNLRVDALTTTSARLRWANSGEGAGYDLQWRVAGSTAWNTVGNLTDTTYALTNLTHRTTYEWQVRSQCANGSAFETTVSFTTADDCALGLHTLRAGSWDDPAVWSCSRVPTAGERVQIRHRLTLPDGYTAPVRTIQYELGGKLSFGTGARLRLGE